MVFMLDQEYRIKAFFDRWRKQVFDPAKGFGYLEDSGETAGYGKDIKIFQLTRQHIPSYTTTLTQAWPKSISDINFDAAATNSPAVFTVNFVYGGQERTDTLGAIFDAVGIKRPSFI